jgi:hypothetical protein
MACGRGAHARGQPERALADPRLDLGRERGARTQPLDRLRFRQAMVRANPGPQLGCAEAVI